ncbi:MAG: hypothetical protein Q4F70_05320 [Clostridia bacterium]|nr:hypothetical protein [Clostridia bacterium]
MAKKKRSKFYTIYFAVIILFFIALIVGSIILVGWLRSFEQSQPTTIVNSLISEYITPAKYEKLQKNFDIEISEYETEEHLYSLLSENFDGKKITISHSSLKPEGIDDAYIIKADDVKVLNVFLKKHKIGKGYDVDSIEISKNLLKTVTISAFKDTVVTVNGIEVAEDIRVDMELPELPKVDAKKLTPPQTITLSGMLSEAQEVAASKNGKDVEVTVNGAAYSVAQNIDATVAKNVQDTAQNAAVAYAAYMQKDGSLGEVAKYTDTSTPFYKNVASTLIQFVKNHNGYKNSDMKVDTLVQYSDTLYSCRVSFKHTLLLANSTYPDNFDKIVYVLKNGESYKVIDMQNPQTAE